MRDVGYQLHIDLIRDLQAMNLPVVVVDSKNILLNPEAQLTKLCKAVGIPFDKAMLSWKKGARPEDGIWAKYWYANVHNSTGFQPYQAKTEPFPKYLEPLLEECARHKEERFTTDIHRHRNRFTFFKFKILINNTIMQLKQLFYALFACAILFIACKKDDEDSGSSANIVGTWDIVSTVASNCTDSTQNGTTDFSLFACTDTNADNCLEISFEFKDDGTLDNTTVLVIDGMESSDTATGTYTVTGDEVEICFPVCITGTVSGGQMTFTGNDPDSGCDTDTILEKQ